MAHSGPSDARAIAVSYRPVPYVPEVWIHQAEPDAGLWDATGGGYHSDRPPPFWAFPWPGGQGLARFVLDHRDVVAGHSVIDLGAGSGLVALAASIAGAARVRAVETDAAAVAAIERNEADQARREAAEPAGREAAEPRHGAAKRAPVEAVLRDLLDVTATGADSSDDLLDEVDVLLAGDLFYTQPLADRAMRFLRRAERAGVRVLVGDAGRGFLPTDRFDLLAHYDVPTRAAVEDAEHVRSSVWQLRRSASAVT
jgi:predicted nicotinamide N-methyase